MFDVVLLGAGGLGCLAFGVWFIGRLRRRNTGTRAGWGAMALGLGLIIRAAGILAGSRQPLGLILALCFGVLNVGGFFLLASHRDKRRNGRSGRKQPQLRP
ncbi:hypothetical protein FHX80_111670 [Streptomyces brevispora]|uniref:Uncharacterized protein n=1 Tax=Streptomyces brevispora TaxID=887462 RepID=A0A561UV60_9ACTN|nr:hypothetical protein [Streptomyces brevispora]TWG03250.1 hypothetical protein FHX80_111670 [Streptomyces brevispora]